MGSTVMNADEELQALWIEVFGEPPIVKANAALLTGILVAGLPAAAPYEPRSPTAEAASTPLGGPAQTDRSRP